MPAGEGFGEQASYLGGYQRDHAGVRWQGLARRGRGRRLGVGAVLRWTADGADGQGAMTSTRWRRIAV